ncbi:MAG: hypothetical protein ACE5NG_20505 [bacterium]
METPDLDQMWETVIKIPVEGDTIHLDEIYSTIRTKISPLIVSLKGDGILKWYCFLIHNRNSGVPTSEDYDNPYFHLRLEFTRDIDPLNTLPSYCVMTRKIHRKQVESINGIDKSLLKNGSIENAWRIIGEQAEWLLDLLNIHKEDADIPPEQIGQFLHFYANMTCVAVR